MTSCIDVFLGATEPSVTCYDHQKEKLVQCSHLRSLEYASLLPDFPDPSIILSLINDKVVYVFRSAFNALLYTKPRFINTFCIGLTNSTIQLNIYSSSFKEVLSWTL